MTQARAKSYREHFATDDQARAYERTTYGAGTYDSILWAIEKQRLAELVQEFRRTHERIDYLDFACGTGRILSFLEGQVDSALGVEISPSMAEVARSKLARADVVCGDITAGGAIAQGKFDLITAFRFFLNAEPPLRLAAMRALADRLEDETSWLIFNNHGNLWSHKLALWPYHAARRPRHGHPTEGNYLSHGTIARLVDEAGLRIERVFGMGFLSAKMLRVTSPERVLAWERRLAGGSIARWGVSQLYVVRRRR